MPMVAARTALMVWRRFSAWSNTMLAVAGRLGWIVDWQIALSSHGVPHLKFSNPWSGTPAENDQGPGQAC